MRYQYDKEHLRLLAIFHYVLAGMAALVGCFPIIHLALGVAILSGAMDNAREAPPRALGAIFAGFAAVLILLFWLLAGLLVVAGRSLGRYERYRFCMVVAVVACLWMPLGTLLGVFTLIVLMRPTVKELFGEAEPPPPRELDEDDADAPTVLIPPTPPPPDDGSYRPDRPAR